jgi:hypothetical protein
MTAQESILQNAYETTLALAIGADLAETSVQVNAAPVGSPSAANPMYLVIDPDSDSTREYIKVTSRSGVSLTVVRNIDSDSGGLNAHAVGAKVRMVAMKQHFDDLNDRVDTIMNSAGTAVNTSGLVKDEDDMASDSDTHLATQQSIKKYVDDQLDTKDTLAELDDVTITSVGDNEVLAYDNVSSKFINQTASEAGLATNADLTSHTGNTSNPHSVTADQAFTTAPTSDLDINNNKLTNVTDPASAQDAATKNYVDTQVQSKDTLGELNDVTITTVADNDVIAYDTTSGDYINQSASEAGLATSSDLTSHTGNTSNPHSVTAAQTGATTTSNKITDFTAPTSDLDMNSNKITNVTDPTAAQDAATKSYVDAQVDTADTLAELNDVTITTVADNDVIAYDSTSGEYINQSASEAGLATSAQGALADSATQPGDNVSTLTNNAGYLTTIDLTGESIDELSDVDTSTVAPTEGQALLWDSTDGEWQPGDVASSTAAKIIDTDGDTQIQTEESADEDILRFDTAGTERATMSTTMALTSAGGAYVHSQNQTSNYTIGSTDGAVYAGPLTISGVVTNAGTMVIL